MASERTKVNAIADGENKADRHKSRERNSISLYVYMPKNAKKQSGTDGQTDRHSDL